MCRTVWLGLRTRSSRSFYIWKYDVRSHPGTQTIITIRQANLHPKYLLNPIFDRLDVTRGELSLSVHLLHYAVEVGARIDRKSNTSELQSRFGISYAVFS